MNIWFGAVLLAVAVTLLVSIEINARFKQRQAMADLEAEGYRAWIARLHRPYDYERDGL